MRVTGGSLAGRRLRVPRRGVRPTADRVRESLFARLGDLSGARVLDLYAGSGALGIEALSRGADALVAVERARACLEVLHSNFRALGVEEQVRVVAGDAVAALPRLAAEAWHFDLVLLDPPYRSREASRALAALARSALLAPAARVVLERGRRDPVEVPAGLALRDERRYGETVIARLEATGRGDG
jgi:16S rRNA (guanine966-N2)-methyltransferase